VIAEVENENPFFPVGTVLRGHEFHQSRLVMEQGAKAGDPALTTAYRLTKGQGLGNGRDGLVYRNVLATYTHLHIGGAPGWAQSFVSKSKQFHEACQYTKAGSI
jgi:cobyrinic acid a,c-diamide synthase